MCSTIGGTLTHSKEMWTFGGKLLSHCARRLGTLYVLSCCVEVASSIVRRSC